MSRLRGEGGLTLVELLVAMTLNLVVLGAVVTLFADYQMTSRRTQLRAEAQDRARLAVNLMARDLRNQVSVSSPSNASLERADPYDLMTLTADPAPAATNVKGLRRVRYCLDATDPASARIVVQTQTWPSGVLSPPPGAGCPATGWTTTRTLVTGVSNRRDGLDRPVWQYGSTIDGAATTLTGVDIALWTVVDKRRSTEVSLRSGIGLRNVNRPPIAAFTSTPLNGAVVLNASPSQDPENGPLRYAWYVGTTPIGTGERIEYSLPSGSAAITLKVTDSGDITAESTRTVASS